MKELKNYALITAALNEEDYIEKTIRSITNQMVLPKIWVIVDDGSTDGTVNIIDRYVAKFPWIRLMKCPSEGKRSFARQAKALNMALAEVINTNTDFIGCLDADIELLPDYFLKMIKLFLNNNNLGIVGGWIWEYQNGRWKPRKGNRTDSVPGAIQFFRKKLLKNIGGFFPLKYGGLDTLAEFKVRSYGWNVFSSVDSPVKHLRPSGGASNPLTARFRNGKMDWDLGYHPLYELVRTIPRSFEEPYFIGAFASVLGYLCAWVGPRKRSTDPSTVMQIKHLQMQRLINPKKFLKRFGKAN